MKYGYKGKTKIDEKLIIVTALNLAIMLIAISLLTSCMLNPLAGQSYFTSDVAEYGNYSGNIREEREGMFSSLEIFPDELPTSAIVNDYYYYCNNGGLLDNSYQLYLVCSYEDNDFAFEKERLAAIAYILQDEIYKPIVTNDGFEYPAVITVFDYKNSFEYALFDDSTKTIAYIYVQTLGIEETVVPSKYRPKGFTVPEDMLNQWGNFNLYHFKAYV